MPTADLVVAKVGSSSVTTAHGRVDATLLASIAEQVAAVVARGTRVVLVTSGAVAAGLEALGIDRRPGAIELLQAASAVGQSRVMHHWQDALGAHGLTVGQVLLDPADFFSRRSYVLAGRTFAALLDLGVVPIVNENDAVADQELRFGDNDRLAALVAVLVGARRLVLLTDAAGVFTADPSRFADATLIDEVADIDQAMALATATSSSGLGTGGMASKLAAARLATWAGIETVIADARADRIVERLVAGDSEGATALRARRDPLSARKAWLAFATVATGSIAIDAGAHDATARGASLLLAGVAGSAGEFDRGDAVELTLDGALVAKGLARLGADELAARRDVQPVPRDVVVVHRDDLVALA